MSGSNLKPAATEPLKVGDAACVPGLSFAAVLKGAAKCLQPQTIKSAVTLIPETTTPPGGRIGPKAPSLAPNLAPLNKVSNPSINKAIASSVSEAVGYNSMAKGPAKSLKPTVVVPAPKTVVSAVSNSGPKAQSQAPPIIVPNQAINTIKAGMAAEGTKVKTNYHNSRNRSVRHAQENERAINSSFGAYTPRSDPTTLQFRQWFTTTRQPEGVCATSSGERDKPAEWMNLPPPFGNESPKPFNDQAAYEKLRRDASHRESETIDRVLHAMRNIKSPVARAVFAINFIDRHNGVSEDPAAVSDNLSITGNHGSGRGHGKKFRVQLSRRERKIRAAAKRQAIDENAGIGGSSFAKTPINGRWNSYAPIYGRAHVGDTITGINAIKQETNNASAVNYDRYNAEMGLQSQVLATNMSARRVLAIQSATQANSQDVNSVARLDTLSGTTQNGSGTGHEKRVRVNLFQRREDFLKRTGLYTLVEAEDEDAAGTVQYPASTSGIIDTEANSQDENLVARPSNLSTTAEHGSGTGNNKRAPRSRGQRRKEKRRKEKRDAALQALVKVVGANIAGTVMETAVTSDVVDTMDGSLNSRGSYSRHIRFDEEDHHSGPGSLSTNRELARYNYSAVDGTVGTTADTSDIVDTMDGSLNSRGSYPRRIHFDGDYHDGTGTAPTTQELPRFGFSGPDGTFGTAAGSSGIMDTKMGSLNSLVSYPRHIRFDEGDHHGGPDSLFTSRKLSRYDYSAGDGAVGTTAGTSVIMDTKMYSLNSLGSYPRHIRFHDEDHHGGLGTGYITRELTSFKCSAAGGTIGTAADTRGVMDTKKGSLNSRDNYPRHICSDDGDHHGGPGTGAMANELSRFDYSSGGAVERFADTRGIMGTMSRTVNSSDSNPRHIRFDEEGYYGGPGIGSSASELARYDYSSGGAIGRFADTRGVMSTPRDSIAYRDNFYQHNNIGRRGHRRGGRIVGVTNYLILDKSDAIGTKKITVDHRGIMNTPRDSIAYRDAFYYHNDICRGDFLYRPRVVGATNDLFPDNSDANSTKRITVDTRGITDIPRDSIGYRTGPRHGRLGHGNGLSGPGAGSV